MSGWVHTYLTVLDCVSSFMNVIAVPGIRPTSCPEKRFDRL